MFRMGATRLVIAGRRTISACEGKLSPPEAFRVGRNAVPVWSDAFGRLNCGVLNRL